MWLKKNVVMLPTDVSNRYNCTEGLLVKCIKSWTPVGEAIRETNKLSISKNSSKGVLDYYETQHLYIVSDEEIKEGDWRVLKFKNWDNYTETIITNTQFVGGNYDTISEQKIIATTDKSITINGYDSSDEDAVVNCYLPQIPQQFIEKYIEEYNKGNQIEEVMIEYETSQITKQEWFQEAPYRVKYDITTLKVKSDNTITIRKIKNSWTREEVIELLHKSLNANVVFNDKFNKIFHEQLDEWIKENL